MANHKPMKRKNRKRKNKTPQPYARWVPIEEGTTASTGILTPYGKWASTDLPVTSRPLTYEDVAAARAEVYGIRENG